MTVTTAARLHSRLKKCVDKGVDISIHAQKVAAIDYAALQLLCAMVAQVRENGCSVTWRKPSGVLLESAAITGLNTVLGTCEQSNRATQS